MTKKLKATRVTNTPGRSGPVTDFPNKVRTAIALQLPADLHEQLNQHLKATGKRRSDFICHLISAYGREMEQELIELGL